MTPEQEQKIAELATAAFHARERVRANMMRNVAPLTYEDREKFAVQCALDEARQIEAERQLSEAQR